jgi:hypothetical protein
MALALSENAWMNLGENRQAPYAGQARLAK